MSEGIEHLEMKLFLANASPLFKRVAIGDGKAAEKNAIISQLCHGETPNFVTMFAHFCKSNGKNNRKLFRKVSPFITVDPENLTVGRLFYNDRPPVW